MSNCGESSSINKTFILEPLSITGGSPTLSACTALYSNFITSCSGNTSVNLGTNLITFYGNLSGSTISAHTINGDFYYSGGTLLRTAVINIISGQTVGIFLPLSGGTLLGDVTGTSITTNNIYSSSISATSITGTTLFSGNTNLNSLFTTFTYVNSLALGLIWQQPLELINVIADSSIPVTGNTNDAFIIKTGANTGLWSGFSAGDLIQYQSSGWRLIKSLIVGDRFGVSFKSSTTPYGSFSGANNYIVTITGGTSGAFTYLLESPINNWAVYVDNQNAYYKNVSFAYSNSLGEWVQLSAGLDYVFSSGLTVVGNIVTSTYITGTSFTNNNLVLSGSNGVNLTTLINNFSGITSNSISATSISANTFVSGGTNLLNLINNTIFSGGSGNCITDFYVTNVHGCSPVSIHDNVRLLSGLRVTGNSITDTLSATSITGLTLYTNSFSANTISATTYQNLPIDIFISGGNVTNGIFSYVNTSGGTFSFKNKQLINNASTGLISGCTVSINSNPTKFNISSGSIMIVDNWTDINNPTITTVVFSGQSGVTTTYLTSSTLTHISIDVSGNILQSPTEETNSQRRDAVMVGILNHPMLTGITSVIEQVDTGLSPLSQYRDLMSAFKLINRGNVISANGTNLKFNKSSGYLFGQGINYYTNVKDPHKKEISATTASGFYYKTQTGFTDSLITDIDVLNYDLNGVVTAIGGTTRAQNQRVFLLSNGTLTIQYGQTWYTNLANAIQGLQSENFIIETNNNQFGILIGIISIQRNCTALNDTTRCAFIPVTIFGQNIGGGSGVATTTLQQAYNNSTSPEITTSNTLGALTIINGDGSDNVANLFEGVSSGGSITSIIRADGFARFNTLSATSISAITYYGNGSNLTNIPNTFITGSTTNNINRTYTLTNNTGGTVNINGLNDVFVTGGSYSLGTLSLTNNTGNTFNVGGFFTSANDVYTTGMTLNAGNYNLTLTRNDGTVLTTSLGILSSDVTITGGTYNSSSGIATFINNTGGTFNVSGFITGLTDTSVTSFSYNNANKFSISDSTGGTFNAIINTVTGLTVNGTLISNILSGSSLTIKGLDTSSATTAVTITNSVNQNILRVFNNGNITIGSGATNPTNLGVFRINQNNITIDIGEQATNNSAIWLSTTGTPTSLNYTLLTSANFNTILNAPSASGGVYFSIGGSIKAFITPSLASFYVPVSASTITGQTLNVNGGNSWVNISEQSTGVTSFWGNQTTNSSTNYGLQLQSNITALNSVGDTRLNVNGSIYIRLQNSLALFNVPVSATTISGQTYYGDNIYLPNTTTGTTTGVIYKGGNRFIHNFNYGYNGTVTTDGFNTFVGVLAGNFTMGSTAINNYESSTNTGIGYQALLNLTRGYDNTSVGQGAGINITSGYSNTVVGARALYQTTFGYSNVAIGSSALYSNSLGTHNIGIGYASLYGIISNSSNIGIGANAGRYISGASATLTSSTSSIFIGTNSYPLGQGQSNQIVIGDATVGNGSNTVTIGNSSITNNYFNGRLIVPQISATTITASSMADIASGTTRIVEASSGGTLSATKQVVSAFGIPASAQTQLSAAVNWDINGNYTGTSLSNIYQGQMYYDGNYFFMCVVDNTMIRLIRG